MPTALVRAGDPAYRWVIVASAAVNATATDSPKASITPSDDPAVIAVDETSNNASGWQNAFIVCAAVNVTAAVAAFCINAEKPLEA